jgi:hypothetical protein
MYIHFSVNSKCHYEKNLCGDVCALRYGLHHSNLVISRYSTRFFPLLWKFLLSKNRIQVVDLRTHCLSPVWITSTKI